MHHKHTPHMACVALEWLSLCVYSTKNSRMYSSQDAAPPRRDPRAHTAQPQGAQSGRGTAKDPDRLTIRRTTSGHRAVVSAQRTPDTTLDRRQRRARAARARRARARPAGPRGGGAAGRPRGALGGAAGPRGALGGAAGPRGPARGRGRRARAAGAQRIRGGGCGETVQGVVEPLLSESHG